MINLGEGEIEHFRRFHGYDCSRGAVMMSSFHLESRVPVFGREFNSLIQHEKDID